MHRYALALLIVTSPFSAFAAELPKEGSYDYTACWSGVNNMITFSKTHTGSSFELTGTVRSNPPGGMFDKSKPFSSCGLRIFQTLRLYLVFPEINGSAHKCSDVLVC